MLEGVGEAGSVVEGERCRTGARRSERSGASSRVLFSEEDVGAALGGVRRIGVAGSADGDVAEAVAVDIAAAGERGAEAGEWCVPDEFESEEVAAGEVEERNGAGEALSAVEEEGAAGGTEGARCGEEEVVYTVVVEVAGV